MKITTNLKNHPFLTTATIGTGILCTIGIILIGLFFLNDLLQNFETIKQNGQIVHLTPKTPAGTLIFMFAPFFSVFVIAPFLRILNSDDRSHKNLINIPGYFSTCFLPVIIFVWFFGGPLASTLIENHGYRECESERQKHNQQTMTLFFTNGPTCPSLDDLIALKNHHRETGERLTNVNQLPVNQ